MRKKIFSAVLIILSLTVLSAYAGNFFFTINLPVSLMRSRPGASDMDESKLPAPSSSAEATRMKLSFDLSRINLSVIREFETAWRYAKSGTSDVEGLVLIFRKLDGSYFAAQGAFTNEYKQVSFKWHPNAIAIVHTHPNNVNPEPNGNDCRIADRLGVPVFTLTSRGMFMYDSRTRKITRVQEGIDWLDPAKWAN
ncbi:MAG: hypothetical protein AB1631_12315 [Acidobacteriota bacterium]